MRTKRTVVLALSAVTTVFLGACASTGKNFGKIYPGMTTDQVASTMKKGPKRVENFDDGYSSWYYDDDRCLLMKKGEVATKEESKKGTNIEIWGIGGYKTKQMVECVPPGYAKKNNVKRKIETPFGDIEK